jgi:hypothetical protein
MMLPSTKKKGIATKANSMAVAPFWARLKCTTRLDASLIGQTHWSSERLD